MGQTYQFKITLMNTNPPIWRRLVIKNTHTLKDLHCAIQDAMGWINCEIHYFEVNGKEIHSRNWDNYTSREHTSMPLSYLGLSSRDSFLYVYDHKKNWKHSVELEAIQDITSRHNYLS